MSGRPIKRTLRGAVTTPRRRTIWRIIPPADCLDRPSFGCLSRSSRKRFERIEALPVAQLDRCYAHAERAVVTGVGDVCIARQQDL